MEMALDSMIEFGDLGQMGSQRPLPPLGWVPGAGGESASALEVLLVA
jgi:hypothetical protein